jgi:hypothetical protein
MAAFWGNTDFALPRVYVFDKDGKMLFGEYYGQRYIGTTYNLASFIQQLFSSQATAE